MKKIKISRLFITAFTIQFILLSGVCSADSKSKNADRWDAGTYFLEKLSLDGEETDVTEAYPEGAYLRLATDGTALLTLGTEQCEASYLEADTSFRLTFGNMTASGERQNGRITLSFGDTGLEYVFRETDEDPGAFSDESGITVKIGAEPDALAGNWSGRIWFEEPEGEWADWVYRSTALSGTVSSENSEGRRTVELYSEYYSDSVPFLTAEFTKEGETYHCLSGYVLSYPVSEWAMEITLTAETESNLRNTVIIEKPGDYGHVFTEEKDGTEDEITDILRLSGTCRDADGSFRYEIELTEDTYNS